MNAFLFIKEKHYKMIYFYFNIIRCTNKIYKYERL